PPPSTLEAWLAANPQAPGLLIATLCVLGLLVALGPRIASWHRGKGRPLLEPLQAEELMLGAGLLVLDLREDPDYRAGHIRGALPVPYRDLATRFQQPDPLAKRALLLVDETDALAHEAYALLAARGFQWMYVLKGGMVAWRRSRRPLVK
ncbi:MAG: rhodanese-like domain-containing protein, partial [Acidobacteria bacterium]|nr:rhodanese-like domain-containing protein [Acidobacteriota bacterium]